MEKRLTGKVALVTGSGGLIGPHVVRRLAAEGAAVAVTDLDGETAEKLAAEITAAGGRAFAAALDVTDSDRVTAVFAAAEQALGPLDILVNNAGLLRKRAEPFQKTQESQWRKIIDVNLGGTILCCHAVLAGMIARRRGKIINLASIAGISGLPGWADYAAAKGGVIAFSRTLAMEAGYSGVTVNCVSPGMIAGAQRQTPGTWLDRTGSPEDVAAVIAFLASPEADFITGCNYRVDGGRTVGPKGAVWSPEQQTTGA